MVWGPPDCPSFQSLHWKKSTDSMNCSRADFYYENNKELTSGWSEGQRSPTSERQKRASSMLAWSTKNLGPSQTGYPELRYRRHGNVQQLWWGRMNWWWGTGSWGAIVTLPIPPPPWTKMKISGIPRRIHPYTDQKLQWHGISTLLPVIFLSTRTLFLNNLCGFFFSAYSTV